MTESKSLLADLEDAVSRGTPESCLQALWHATDILIAGQYSEDQIWTFGEVIGRLAEDIEIAARVRLANKLAPSNNAPVEIIEKLAFDDSIDVAGPVLRHSDRLDARMLIANARSKSQQHLLAISKRKSISDDVTDILVVRGAAEVVKQLISKASDEVKRKLERQRPEMGTEIRAVVTDVTGAIHARFGPASKNYFTAKRTVGKLHRDGNLNEDQIFEFAHSLKFNETAVALSLLCVLPIDVVERALVNNNREVILILAKALELSWTTTMSLLFLAATNYRITARDLDEMKIGFLRLNAETSKQVLKVYQARKEAAVEGSFLRLPQLHAN